MKSGRVLLFVLLCASFGQQALFARLATPVLTTNGLPSRFLALWNGRDLTGWKTFFTNEVDNARFWSASAGVLSLTGKPRGYIYTERSFANYHLHLEWRWPLGAGNSGVFVHLGGDNAIWPRSVEASLQNGVAGELIGQNGAEFSGTFVAAKKHSPIKTSSEKPAGEWNALDIYCRGNSIEIQINGTRQNLVEKTSVTTGALGLQLDGTPIQFRSLWLDQF